jgi:cell division protein FtsB
MDNAKVVYITEHTFWLYDGETFAQTDPSAIKKHPCGTLIAPQALYMYSSKLPSNLDAEQRDIQMDINMHEEGGANVEEEYTTATLCHPLVNDTNDLVDLFGLPSSSAEKLYDPLLKKTGVIDYILPSFLIYDAFYDKSDAPKGTELFVYLGDEEAYGVIYHKGHYVAHRVIEHLAHLAAHCDMELEALKALLKSKGVVEENYTPDEMNIFTTAQDILAKSVERIVHTINHKRGLFGLGELERIVLDFEGETIEGLETIFQAFGVEEKTIEPLHAKAQIDPALTHHVLGAAYLLGVAKGRYPAANVSPFLRQPPLLKQPAGKFLTIFLSALLVALLYPAYLMQQTAQMTTQEEALKVELATLQTTQAKQAERLKGLQEDHKQLEEEAKALQQKEARLAQTQDALPVIRASSALRTRMMDEALRLLQRHTIALKELDQEGSKAMKLHVVVETSKRENIAKFIEGMAKLGYQQSRTKKIFQNEQWHESVVEVVR